MNDKAQQLAWEAKWRMPAVISSIVAGLLLFGGAMALEVAIAPHDPVVGLVQALQPALQGQAQAAIDPHTAHLLYINSHALGILAAGIVAAIGTILAAGILVYLAVAVRARSERGNALATSLAISGPVLVGLAQIADWIFEVADAHSFATHSDRSHTAVVNATNSGGHVVAYAIGLAGSLAMLLAFILVSRGAMQTGLVTRFLGWMGVAAGVFFVLPFFPLPLVQTFWLVAIAVFLSGWGGNELPDAWKTGEARPLPTAAELRAARQEERERGPRAKPVRPEPTPAPVAPTGVPSPATSRKRKRKRR